MNELTIISEAELHQIHGGHLSFATGYKVIDIPMAVIGLAVLLRESINFGVDLYNNAPEENDHFGHFLLGCRDTVVGCFK
jgi:hypothetical protein